MESCCYLDKIVTTGHGSTTNVTLQQYGGEEEYVDQSSVNHFLRHCQHPGHLQPFLEYLFNFLTFCKQCHFSILDFENFNSRV